MRLFYVNEAAEKLGLHPVTVRNWARAGKLRGIKTGTHWKFDEDYLELWAKQQPQTATPWSAARRAAYEKSLAA
jgi:excisionase family DNA binding protein